MSDPNQRFPGRHNVDLDPESRSLLERTTIALEQVDAKLLGTADNVQAIAELQKESSRHAGLLDGVDGVGVGIKVEIEELKAGQVRIEGQLATLLSTRSPKKKKQDDSPWWIRVLLNDTLLLRALVAAMIAQFFGFDLKGITALFPGG